MNGPLVELSDIIQVNLVLGGSALRPRGAALLLYAAGVASVLSQPLLMEAGRDEQGAHIY